MNRYEIRVTGHLDSKYLVRRTIGSTFCRRTNKIGRERPADIGTDAYGYEARRSQEEVR